MAMIIPQFNQQLSAHDLTAPPKYISMHSGAAKSGTCFYEIHQVELKNAAISHYQWQHPELSIGAAEAFWSLGEYKCWSLKEKSPAHVLWKAVSGRIISLLEVQFEQLNTKDSDLKVMMFIIGRKPTRSSPVTLFTYENRYSR